MVYFIPAFDCKIYFISVFCDIFLRRVEAAFRKFDTDGDGFIDWHEFKQVGTQAIKTSTPLLLID